ncbi:amino acid adenylation domain-containing protein [Actinophytocola gossypii]|uniref:Amino acid adenylation domain-containing protein n=1 Tax=Actinophytocola gossypii TaxID=2812003 RepID=A0ABT2J5I3_9PSEU|nr:amino acid adenylation domain-containing protein [Actinophytocola gossypii]MCT2582859.1 amino acid adenylation domain-containing protein [Actinophytocola gossypii]
MPLARKRQLLAEALRRRPAAPRAYPLSFGQQRLWFLDKFAPGEPVYSIPMAFRLTGALDIGALRSSVDTIVGRHASLRTTFPDQGGEPVQVVTPAARAAFEVVELSGPADEAADRFLLEQARRGFDLARGPLFRTTLGVLGPDDHVLVFNIHHIVSDAWSLSVLLNELTALYRAGGTGAELPELPVQYPDYTTWQRERQHGPEVARQLDYWTDHLDGAPELLTLPTDRPRPPVQGYRGALHMVPLSAGLAADLEAMARECGGTLFMALLAAFGAQLGRLAGQDDVVVSTPVAGRSDPSLEPLIGFFVNTLPLRLRTGGDPTFAELVARAKEVTVGGLSNAEVPFERLVETLRPERSLGHPPVSQVQLILHNVPRLEIELPGVDCTGLLPDPGVSKLDLSLILEQHDGGLLMSLEYNTDLFDVETVDRFATSLLDLLRAAVADPHRPLSELTAVSGVERWQVVVGFNDTATEPSTATTALDLIPFTGTGTAVSGVDGTLTYAELDERANRLAHLLRAHGVGPDVPVGLHLARTTAMVVAMLAVWRAGGAYLPLDPAWPAERLALMVADSGTSLVVGDGTFTTVPVLRPDDPRLAEQPVTPPEVAVHGENLAYLIYTSGSTGRPKGVGVPHRAVVNLLTSFADLLAIEPADRLAAVTTLSFDISVLELLVPLVAGARVVVVTSEEAADGPALRRRLVESGATVMQATPATWRLLGTAGGVPDGVAVRICGGEAFPPDLADELRADGAVVWNAYGPTETTVWSAAGPVGAGGVHIGPPIGNTQLYVLDGRGDPVPVGVVGELHVGGLGVTRGYHGRPGLTADRFRPDPFAGVPGARLYATGDLARYRADGLLEFLGRADQQVKVRGFRIELGEIEAALLADPRVREVVVGTHGTGQDVRLVAHLVPSTPDTPDAGELRAWLRHRLPEYMVPTAFTWLDAMPLTANGKVDRRSLPAPDFTSEVEWVAPRDPVEEVLAGIWREVLGLPRIGVRDDFFRIGGHSLLAAKVLARTREAFAIDVPIHRMFAAPTVEGVAATLAELQAEPGQVATIAKLRMDVAGLSDDEVRALLGE